MTPRRADWQPRLIEYLARIARQPLKYGTHDCALFAAGAVEAMTGADPAARWRGRYSTVRGGLRHLRAAGYLDHITLCASLFTEAPVARARAGDLAVLPGPDGPALGVVQGEFVYVLRAEGLAWVELLAAERVFQV
ncbi:MAG: hypothetical protein U1D35_06395 [Paracoccaceae bacterium]|nr:hypothetical protein [Paracoccaceae bacterium]